MFAVRIVVGREVVERSYCCYQRCQRFGRKRRDSSSHHDPAAHAVLAKQVVEFARSSEGGIVSHLNLVRERGASP